MSASPVRVVAVSDDALRSTLLDALLADGNPHDVVFVESLARAHTRIRQLLPDLIIVFMRIDDEDACRLLTMLEIDREVAAIPVVTWTTGDSECEPDLASSRPLSAGHSAFARV